MRYLGDPTAPAVPIPQLGSGQPLDPLVKAQLLAIAPQIPDAQAQDLLDFVDATPLGNRTKMMRIGLGAAVGLVLGIGIGKVLLK